MTSLMNVVLISCICAFVAMVCRLPYWRGDERAFDSPMLLFHSFKWMPIIEYLDSCMIGLAVLGVLLCVLSVKVVPFGFGGVEKGFAGEILRSLEPGVYVIRPWHSVETESCRWRMTSPKEPEGVAVSDWVKSSSDVPVASEVQVETVGLTENLQAELANSLSCSTKEQQTVYVVCSCGWRINASKLAELKRRVHGDVEATLLMPLLIDSIKSEVARYESFQVLPNKAQICDAIETKLKAGVESYGLEVSYVLISQVLFSQGIETALESKFLSEQLVKQRELEVSLAEKQKELKEINAETDKKVSVLKENAKRDAEQTVALATVEAEKTVKMAEAQSLKMRADSLTKKIVTYKAMQCFDWEKLPSVLYLSEGQFSEFMKMYSEHVPVTPQPQSPVTEQSAQ